MNLTTQDIEAIASKTADELSTRKRAQWVDPETHQEHHTWVSRQLKRETEYSELRQKILTSACIWAIPIVLAFALSALGRELVRLMRAGAGS